MLVGVEARKRSLGMGRRKRRWGERVLEWPYELKYNYAVGLLCQR